MGDAPAGGAEASQPRNPFGWGADSVGFPPSGTWGVFSRRSVCESMHVHVCIWQLELIDGHYLFSR